VLRGLHESGELPATGRGVRRGSAEARPIQARVTGDSGGRPAVLAGISAALFVLRGSSSSPCAGKVLWRSRWKQLNSFLARLRDDLRRIGGGGIGRNSDGAKTRRRDQASSLLCGHF